MEPKTPAAAPCSPHQCSRARNTFGSFTGDCREALIYDSSCRCRSTTTWCCGTRGRGAAAEDGTLEEGSTIFETPYEWFFREERRREHERLRVEESRIASVFEGETQTASSLVADALPVKLTRRPGPYQVPPNETPTSRDCLIESGGWGPKQQSLTKQSRARQSHGTSPHYGIRTGDFLKAWRERSIAACDELLTGTWFAPAPTLLVLALGASHGVPERRLDLTNPRGFLRLDDVVRSQDASLAPVVHLHAYFRVTASPEKTARWLCPPEGQQHWGSPWKT